MADKILFGRSGGFKEKFAELPEGSNRIMHYCPGCGHGIAHKLIAEAINDFGIKDRTILISPVGCAVFAYRYFDCAGISVPHGRAPAVGSGLSRANPENVVISYQGDGDLGAIGLAEIMHAANRGENICVVFINNAIYGMTGGQMAPTTLVGQKTITTPDGRKMELDGSPMRISELIAALDAPIYVERAVLSTPSEIMKARKALRKAIKNTIERKGFSFVELLSGCPVGLKSDPVKINDFLDSQLAEIFPPGVFRDCAAMAPEKSMPVPVTDAERIIELLTADEKCSEAVTPNGVFPEILRIKIAGAGGQGVLSLGALLAQIGKMAGYYVSFLPAYGPEMRGGTANCSVIISRSLIAAPVVDNNIDLLIALNEPSLLRYENAVNSNGRIVYDASACSMPEKPNMIQLPGGSLAAGQLGNVKAGNIILLGACIASWGKPNNQQEKLYNLAQAAIAAQFSGNAGVMQLNLAALELGMNTLEQN